MHKGLHALDHLTEIVRRDIGRHTYGNTFGTVDQKIGHAHGKNDGFLFRFVKIRSEIHHVFVQIRKICLLRHLLQACLRITHGRGAVPFDGAEITMPVDKRQSLFKALAHYHQRFVNGAVPVGMVFTHRIAHDTRTFTVGSVIADPQFIHIIECPSLYGL